MTEPVQWPPFRDSVELRVVEMHDDAWAAVATHAALGDDIGCAFQWGETEQTVTTPGGTDFPGGSQIVCDEVQGSRRGCPPCGPRLRDPSSDPLR